MQVMADTQAALATNVHLSKSLGKTERDEPTGKGLIDPFLELQDSGNTCRIFPSRTAAIPREPDLRLAAGS